MRRKILISEICNVFRLQYIGNDIEINGLNLCNRVSEHNRILSYTTNENYVDSIGENPAVAAIVLKKEHLSVYQRLCEERELVFIICENPEKIFYDIHDYLYYRTDFYEKFDFATRIGENTYIHSSTVIEEGVVVGNNVSIGANTVIRKGTVIKDNCIIGCNSTIGSEGFQILRIDGANRRIVHAGGVLLNEGACIGDNTTVCNTLFEGRLYIGKCAMIDNLVYVGHNVYIGDNAVVTAGTVLCGSSVVKEKAWIGVNSSVLNQVTVGKESKIGIGSVVTRNVPDEALAYGVPAKVKMVLGGE